MKQFSKLKVHHLLLLSIFITFLTGLYIRTCGNGFSGGTCYGFPFPFWIVVTFTDIGVPTGPDDQYKAIEFLLPLIIDFVFWTILLFSSQFVLKKMLTPNHDNN